MKKIVFVLLTILFSASYSFSQDIISMRDSSVVQSKILEVTATEIKYKRFDNLEGPTFIIFKSDVSSVQYQNGSKDIFNVDNQGPTILTPSLPSRDLYMSGYSDATKYYRAYRSAVSATFIVTLIFPPAGLVPAIICSSVKPKESNLGYPRTDLMKMPDYYNGYTHHAKRIKQGKIWGNFGIAFGINILAGIILTSR